MPTRAPTFWRIGSPNGWRVRTAAASVAVSDREGLRLAASPDGPLSLGSGDGSLGGLLLPRGIAIDRKGRVYLLDEAAARIKRFDAESSTFVELPALGGVGDAPREFNQPSAIAIAGNRLYICDAGNQRVQVFDADGLVLLHVWEARGDRAGWEPIDLVARRERVYVLDRKHARVYTHRHGDELTVVAERPDRAGLWSRIAVDRDRRIFALNTEGGVARLESPDPAAPPILDAGSIRDRFDAPAIRFDAQGRFCLPEPLRRRCPTRAIASGPPPETPLALCPPFDRSGAVAGLIFDKSGARVDRVDPSEEPASPLYRREGYWQSTPLDSRTYRCQWHRIELRFSSLPAGGRVVVHTHAHETEGAVDEVPVERWDHAHTIVAPPRPQGKPVGTATTTDFLVQSGGGRFLSIRLTLHGDGFATTAVEAITVHYPRDSYLQYLPATFSSDDESRRFLERFLSVFQTEWDALDRTIAQVERLFDPDAAPPGPFLDHLAAQWMGLRLEGDWTAEQKRALLRAAPEVYSHHGQLAGLRKYVEIYLSTLVDLDPEDVSETGFPVVIEGFRQRQHLFAAAAETARLGESAPLWSESVVRRLQLGGFAREGEVELVSTGSPDRDVFDRYAHRFTVMAPASWVRTADDERMIRRAIDAEKPAQTHYDLCLVDARFRVGEQSTVGVDTIIGAPPATALACEDDDKRAPSLPPSGRLGYDTVLGCVDAAAPVRLAPGTSVGGSRLG